MPITPVFGWPYPALPNRPHGPGSTTDPGFQQLALAVEATLAALQTQVNNGPKGIIARANRTTSSTGTTSEVGVLRIDDVPILGGRAYKIWTSPMVMDTSVANDVIRANIRFTTDGSTPTTASTLLTAVQSRAEDIANGYVIPISVDHEPSVNQTLSLLLTVQRVAGTGTVALIAATGFPINIVVEDMGVDTGDVGTDI